MSLRNSFSETGIRPNRFDQGHALDVDYAQTLEVAGNILERCWRAGIFVFGGKPSGAITDRPFSRMIVYHNKVTDSLLNNCDWGGIETWQGGPSYVYDNISGNPGGNLKWGHMLSPKEPGSSRFGHAYYMDGGFKNYHFTTSPGASRGTPSARWATRRPSRRSSATRTRSSTTPSITSSSAHAGRRPRPAGTSSWATSGTALARGCSATLTRLVPRPPAMRPTPADAAATMTWNFCRDPGDPTHLIDEHWNMAPYYVERDGYYTRPTYPLKAINASAADYERGPLESWTEGALRFNGRDQYAVLTNKDINRTVDYRVRYVDQSGERVSEQRKVSGANLTNPQIHTSNFLIEAHFRTAPGQKDGTLIQKLDGGDTPCASTRREA